MAWHGLTDTFLSLKPEGSHLPTFSILSAQEPQPLGERGLYVLQLRGVGIGEQGASVADVRQGRTAVTPGSLPHASGSDLH